MKNMQNNIFMERFMKGSKILRKERETRQKKGALSNPK